MPCIVTLSDEMAAITGKKEMAQDELVAFIASGGLERAGYSVEGGELKKLPPKEKQHSTKFLKKKVESLKKAVKNLEDKIKSIKVKAKEKKELVKVLQDIAREKMNEMGVEPTAFLEKSLAAIRTERGFARFVEHLELEQLDSEHKEKADKAVGIIKKINKLKKNGKITQRDLETIRSLDLPNPRKVLDIDKYLELLNDYLDAKTGKLFKSNENELREFAAQANADIAEYEDHVQEFNRAVKKIALKNEYESLKESGQLEGTGINSFEDYLDLVESAEAGNQLSEAQERLVGAATAEESAAALNELNETINDPESFNAIKEAMDESGLDLDANLLKDSDLSLLSDADRILLNNVLQGIVLDGDLANVDAVMSKLRLISKKRMVEASMIGRGFRAISESAKRGVRATTNALVYGQKTRDALNNFIFGKFNGAIARNRALYDVAMDNFDKALLKMKDKFKSSVRVDTYAFINQWFTDHTEEERNAEFQERVKKRAFDAADLYKANSASATKSENNKVNIRKAKEVLDALQEWGLIENVTFGDNAVSYTVVPGKTPADIQGKLDAQEQGLYDSIINHFSALTNVPSAIRNVMGGQFRPITNYYPTFTQNSYDSANNSNDDATLKDVLNNFFGVSKTPGRAKSRTNIAGENRTYRIGLRENFSKGYWEGLLINNSSQEINDMVNILRSSYGINALEGLDAESRKILEQAVRGQVLKDLIHGNILSDADKAVYNEIGKALVDGFVGAILKHYNQFIKQSVPSLLANLITSPKSSSLAIEIMSSHPDVHQALRDKVLMNTGVYNRDAQQLQSPFISDFPYEYVMGRGRKAAVYMGRTLRKVQHGLSDIATPLMKIPGTLIKGLPKPVYDSIMTMTDASISEFNLYTGYIEALRNKFPGITNEQIIDKILNEAEDSSALQSGEDRNLDLNSFSNRNDAAEILTSQRALFFLKGFSMATHQAFLNHLRLLAGKDRALLTKEEKADAAKGVARYMIQQLMFRIIVQYIVNISMSKLIGDDDDDKEDPYSGYRDMTSIGTGFMSDMFLGSANVVADFLATYAYNAAWKWWAEKQRESLGLTKDEVSGTALDTDKPLNYGSSVFGGAPAQLTAKVVQGIEKAAKNMETLEKAGMSKAEQAYKSLLFLMPYFLGSGTLRDASGGFEKKENRKIGVIGVVSSRLQSDSMQYTLSSSDYEQIAKEFQNDDLRQLHKRVFVQKDEVTREPEYVVIISNSEYDKIANSQQVKNEIKMKYKTAIHGKALTDEQKKNELRKIGNSVIREKINDELKVGRIKSKKYKVE